MFIGIPQALFLFLTVIGTGLHLARDGEQRKEKYSFGGALVGDAIILGLLYWGGFFS